MTTVLFYFGLYEIKKDKSNTLSVDKVKLPAQLFGYNHTTYHGNRCFSTSTLPCYDLVYIHLIVNYSSPTVKYLPHVLSTT